MTQVRLAADVDDALREHAGHRSLSSVANDVLRSALGLDNGRGRPIPVPGRARPATSPNTTPRTALDGEDGPAASRRSGSGPSSPESTRGDLATSRNATARAPRGTTARRRLPRL